MVIFDELRITRDGETLVIKASVRTDSYYQNVYIDKVIIDTEETYVEDIPSSTPVYTETISGNKKSVTLYLNKADIIPDFREHLFFIYIKTKGTPSSNVPCGMDNTTTLGVTLYMGNIYNNFMSYIKEVNRNNCQIPQGLIDQLLRYKAFNVAIESGHFTQAINYYNSWFNKCTSNIVIPVNCGCNG